MHVSDKDVKIHLQKPFLGFFLILIGLFITLSFADYDPLQSRFYTTKVHNHWQSHGNRLGYCGVYFSFYAYRIGGMAAWLLPIYLLWTGVLFFIGRGEKCSRWKWFFFGVACFFTTTLFAFFEALRWWIPDYHLFSAGAGGLMGLYLFQYIFARYFGEIGCMLVLIPSALFTTFLAFASPGRVFCWSRGGLKRVFVSLKFFWKSGFNGLIAMLHKGCVSCASWRRVFLNRRRRKALGQAENAFSESEQQIPINKLVTVETSPLNPRASRHETQGTCVTGESRLEESRKEKTIQEIKVLESEVVEKSSGSIPAKSGDYLFPPIQLLRDPPPILKDVSEGEDYYETAQDLVQKLAEFGVEVKVEAIQSGPVITRYEVTPARGVRVEKITTLDKNIALGLKALSVRIQAPVPGKGCVGIEIPNKFPLPVCLREILESKAWAHSDAEIPIVLGKEVTGKPIVADLTKMPHLLIAGSTGSGKTVCINAIIASLLFHSSPEELKFIMVDPKIVEMKLYNDLPHMLIPVVTEPKRVPSALKWLIGEMERRYQLFAEHGARNIAIFNDKVKKLSTENAVKEDMRHLPYIVCIIDELADLMMVAPGDIETCIARLAQLARAAGIHLIIATQRPSVNIITGIIKANLPSRIAFKVASKVDSRTILDVGGADSLIGKGDMLFIPPGASQLIRAQGAWVSDEEINDMVQFLTKNGPPSFAEEVQRVLDVNEEDTEKDTWSAEDEDALIPQALEVLKTSDRISTSLLQRRLKIGYNRAARIMETLEQRGWVPNGDARPEV
ncbi:MAG: DNA translocase FtsK [Puniceicoccales bacterium]|jgi:S-DNA-T family DNA segregation ATPase FtsK/SpoIIIE|nr:DNA translocase FtsK [Puniceicoccales bacterium]